ncbi:MAG: hypothetical protein ACE5M4_12580 [Anaerolineales bacterium]
MGEMTGWVVVALLVRPASYLDPGSGSYLLQLLIAGALGALFALRLYWTRVKEFFQNLFSRSADDEDPRE